MKSRNIIENWKVILKFRKKVVRQKDDIVQFNHKTTKNKNFNQEFIKAQKFLSFLCFSTVEVMSLTL